MLSLKHDGIALAFEDTGGDLPPMLLVHGCGFDHTVFAPQVERFRRTHRVFAVDLRGHGESDAPHQEYTMAGFADDLAWLSAELALKKPVVVGHSMGGNAALELAARHPRLLSLLVLIDSCLFPPESARASLLALEQALQGEDWRSAWQAALAPLCLPMDKHASRLIASLHCPRHVLASAWPHHVTRWDAAPAAARCRVPAAYIHAHMPLLDLERFSELTPQLLSAQTLGSGHFATVEVPEQINSMIADFLRMQEHAWKSSAPQA